MKTEYIAIVYDYLVANNILHEFLYNRANHANMGDEQRCDSEPFNYAIIWMCTTEGEPFWQEHNSILQRKLQPIDCSITILDLIIELTALAQQPQAYEFW